MQIRLREAVRLTLLFCAFQVALQAQRPEVLYLRFSETSGSVTADRAFPGLPGVSPTIQNGAAFNTNTNSSGGVVLGPACLKTAGTTTDPCVINTAFSVTGDWTIEFWIIDTESSPSTTRYVFGDPTISNFRCYRDPSGPNSTLTLEGAGMKKVSITTAVQFATWRHIALVHDSRSLTITPYVDGVVRPPVTQPTPIDLVGSGTTGLIVGGFGPGNATWRGRIDEFRVWDRTLSSLEIGAQALGHLNAVTDDVACSSITSPVTRPTNCKTLSASETVSISISNTGTNSIAAGTVIPVEVRVNNVLILSDMVTTTQILNTGDSEVLSIPTPVDLSMTPALTMTVTTMFPGDVVSLNNTATRVMVTNEVPIAAFPYVEDFSGTASNLSILPPPGWVQDPDDSNGTDSEWIFTNQATPTMGTGPSADFSTGLTGGTGYYAYVEDEGNHSAVNLITRCFDFTNTTNPSLKFWLYSDNANGIGGANENFLSVDVITSPGGAITLDVLPQTGHVGSMWQPYVVNLSAFNGTLCRLVFRGRSDGGGDTHDLAIDDITIFDFVPGIGQAPQPGVAVMDINNALSPGLAGVSSGAKGPYTTNVDVGDLLTFDFSGEPSQTIILLLGTKNPGAAIFPVVGSIDIGGPIDPTSMLPTGIVIFADGSVPSGFNPFFNTTSAGTANVFFTMPPVPPGILTTFQAALLNSTPSGVGMTNAIEVTVN